jgi:hypothetical protein
MVSVRDTLMVSASSLIKLRLDVTNPAHISELGHLENFFMIVQILSYYRDRQEP